MRVDDVYGDRSARHQRIMMLSASALHDEFPWTADLAFNSSMTKGQFDEKAIPDASCIMGSKAGVEHRYCVGNEQGEILPKFLMAKLVVIESGKTFGRPSTIVTNDSERDRLFAMVREAQIRGIQPLAIKEEKKKRPRAPAPEEGGPTTKKTGQPQDVEEEVEEVERCD